METRKTAMRGILAIFLSLICIYANGQVEQPKRFEYELKPFENYFDVLILGEKGLVLFRQTDERNKQGREWEIIYLDSDLNEVWTKKYYFAYEYTLTGYAENDEKFYFLFFNEKTGKKHLELFEFDLEGYSPRHLTIENLFAIQLSEFEVTDSAAILGGYYNYRPVLIHYSFEKALPKVLPGVYNNRSELVHLRIHEDNSYTVIMTERTSDKRYTLAVKTYDPGGDLVVNTLLQPEDGKHLIFGRVAKSDSDAQLVAGTYSERRSDYSRGLFIARLDTEGNQTINYYNYGDLENFFSYMKAKRQRRIKERIKRKKVKGKKIKFNYRLLVQEIIENEENGDYLMIGEAFYPKYSHVSRRNYNPYYPEISSFNYYSPNYGNLYLEGYRYTHAVVIGFDEKGKLEWDNSFEITDVLSPTLDQYVNAHVGNNKIVLLYQYENVIRSKIIQGEEVVEGKSFDDIKLKFEDDVADNSNFDVGGLEKWYGDYFITYGVQRIKNLKDAGVRMKRRVFFINKLVYR